MFTDNLQAHYTALIHMKVLDLQYNILMEFLDNLMYPKTNGQFQRYDLEAINDFTIFLPTDWPVFLLAPLKQYCFLKLRLMSCFLRSMYLSNSGANFAIFGAIQAFTKYSEKSWLRKMSRNLANNLKQ